MTLIERLQQVEGPSAFPAGWPEAGYEPTYGMTLLDYFAGQALAGLLSTRTDTLSIHPGDAARIANHSWQLARAMLTARQENSNGH